tara:strand:- start:2329 stop:2601 length:273 start_codon:yes stop_codon:yes gene_type:complete
MREQGGEPEREGQREERGLPQEVEEASQQEGRELLLEEAGASQQEGRELLLEVVQEPQKAVEVEAFQQAEEAFLQEVEEASYRPEVEVEA